MQYVALAAGFDGTLSKDGYCDPRCVDALRSLAASGRRLILLSGRQLRDLLERVPEVRIFDFVVAEHGAVLYRPETRQSAILARAPSEILLQELQRRGVAPLSVGSTVIRTAPEHRQSVGEAAHALRVDVKLLDDHFALMIVPSDLNKVSAVHEALSALGLSPHNLVAIGDAQSDFHLFRFAEHSVAVNNAADDLKIAADRTTQGDNCDGFLELAQQLLSSDLADAQARHRVVLGVGDRQNEVTLSPYRDSLLVCGVDDGARAAFCHSVAEKFTAHAYQCCTVAERIPPGSLPVGTTTIGSASSMPRLNDVLEALSEPSTSVAVDLSAMSERTRALFTQVLLLQVQSLHERVGRPHAVLIHDANRLLAEAEGIATAVGLSDITMVYSCAAMELLPAPLLDSVRLVVTMDDHEPGSATPVVPLAAGQPWARIRYGPGGVEAARVLDRRESQTIAAGGGAGCRPCRGSFAGASAAAVSSDNVVATG